MREQVAFVGPSGGGKTTLARLIARFADVTEGNILIGGVNVKNIDEKELMDTVSLYFRTATRLRCLYWIMSVWVIKMLQDRRLWKR